MKNKNKWLIIGIIIIIIAMLVSIIKTDTNYYEQLNQEIINIYTNQKYNKKNIKLKDKKIINNFINEINLININDIDPEEIPLNEYDIEYTCITKDNNSFIDINQLNFESTKDINNGAENNEFEQYTIIKCNNKSYLITKTDINKYMHSYHKYILTNTIKNKSIYTYEYTAIDDGSKLNIKLDIKLNKLKHIEVEN